MRGGEVDLEAHLRRDLAGLLQPLELAVRRDGVIGIEEVVEMQVRDFLARFQAEAPPAGRGLVDAEDLLLTLERGIVLEHLLQMADPVEALARLTVRQALERAPE